MYSLKSKIVAYKAKFNRNDGRKKKYKSLPIRGFSYRKNSVSLGRTIGCCILIIRRVAGSILGDVILLDTTLITKEEHVIHLLLIFIFQLLLLSSKPDPELLQFFL